MKNVAGLQLILTTYVENTYLNSLLKKIINNKFHAYHSILKQLF